jgi:hypothetical protein
MSYSPDLSDRIDQETVAQNEEHLKWMDMALEMVCSKDYAWNHFTALVGKRGFQCK